MKFIALVNMVSRCISTVLIFLCVKDSGDLIVYCLLYAAVSFTNGVFGTWIVCKRFNLRTQRITWALLREDIIEGWHLFTSSFCSKVLSSLGITFLGWFTSSYICGIYSGLYKIPSMLLLAWNPISQVLYPMVSIKMSESYHVGSAFVKKMQRLFMGLFVVLCLILCLLAEFAVGLLLGENYVAYYYILFPLLGWVLVAIYNNFLGVQMLLAAGFTKEYSSCIRWIVPVSITINLVGIYFWGIEGAVYAPLISEVVLTILLARKRKKVLKTIAQEGEA